MDWYLNGRPAGHAPAPNALTPNDDQLVIGYEEGGDFAGGGRSGFKGMIDEVRSPPRRSRQDRSSPT